MIYKLGTLQTLKHWDYKLSLTRWGVEDIHHAYRYTDPAHNPTDMQTQKAMQTPWNTNAYIKTRRHTVHADRKHIDKPTHIHAHTHLHTCIHTCTHIITHTLTHRYTHNAHTQRHRQMDRNTHTHIYIYTYTYTHTNTTHIYLHTHRHTEIHINAHRCMHR